MKKLIRAVLALLAGTVTFAVGGIAIAELLSPSVWPATLVSLSLSVVLGILVAGLAWGLLVYSDERASLGRATARTERRLLAYIAGSVTFLVIGTAATVAYGPIVAGILVAGLPLGLLSGVVAALVTLRFVGRRRGRVPGSAA